MNDSLSEIDAVFDYHQRTKHNLNRYAQALGYMDWKNQPDPFRRYDGAPFVPLKQGNGRSGPLYDALFSGSILPSPLNFSFISQLFYNSMALSAWKHIPGGAAWPLRVNPSSGNLHPTESYLLIGPQCSSHLEPGLYHYRPDQHALEKRRAFNPALWETISEQLPHEGFLIGLSSIYWRETWKYGERAFRYCHHDVGHAIGAITISSVSLGWNAEVIDTLTDDTTALFLGCDEEGIEAEHVDCLIAIYPHSNQKQEGERIGLHLKDQFINTLKDMPLLGKANRLSEQHHDWPIIEKISAACKKRDVLKTDNQVTTCVQVKTQDLLAPPSGKQAFDIIRQRRSAVAMDGETTLEKSVFYRMLQRLQAENHRHLEPGGLPWPPSISLFLFVHRVRGLDPGLYVLTSTAHHRDLLKKTLTSDFLWEKPEGCAHDLQLYVLLSQDLRQMAKTVSCGQDIAADGVFSLGMLAHFKPVILEKGASFYPRLFWEAGFIGQVLYLEAEAAGLQATGIGCFYDDVMHDLLGITDLSWQSLYHFTVGGPKQDERLQTRSAYHHLEASQHTGGGSDDLSTRETT